MQTHKTYIGRLATTFVAMAALMGCGAESLEDPSLDTEPVAEASAEAKPCGAKMRIRKDVKDLTRAERKAFIRAVKKLKKTPSPYDPSLNYYDQFVAWHVALSMCTPGMSMDGMMKGHMGPVFLPWHRAFILYFEDALREVSHNKHLTLPYWNWTSAESTNAVFGEDFMGGNGDPDQGGAVTTGPFRQGRWKINVTLPAVGEPDYLVRNLLPVAALPKPAEVDAALSIPFYDVAPYNDHSDPSLSFRNFLEGFISPVPVTCEPMPGGMGVMVMHFDQNTKSILHNFIHYWVGGQMLSTTHSPNDPVFFLHHANVDRIWSEWQEIHGENTYLPIAEYPNNSRDDVMMPFDSIGHVVRPKDMASIHKLGYRYQ